MAANANVVTDRGPSLGALRQRCNGGAKVAKRSNNLSLTDAEIAASFADGQWAEQFPPILDVELAAKLAIVPVGTIYDWSSRGLLVNCATKVGKHLRIFRDRFLKTIFNEGFSCGR